MKKRWGHKPSAQCAASGRPARRAEKAGEMHRPGLQRARLFVCTWGGCPWQRSGLLVPPERAACIAFALQAPSMHEPPPAVLAS
jgi:hypothetical protein